MDTIYYLYKGFNHLHTQHSYVTPYCWKQIKNYLAPHETIKKSLHHQNLFELLMGAERGGEGRREEEKWGWEAFSNRLIACLEGSFTHTDKGDVSFNDGKRSNGGVC